MKSVMKLAVGAAILLAASSANPIRTSAMPRQERGAARSYVHAFPAAAMRTVSSGDFTISVPAGWAVRTPSVSVCTKAPGSSEVITGPLSATISHCGAPSITHGTFAVFAHGGPPAAPVLAGQASQVHTVRINGIWVTTFAGVTPQHNESYLLALLDGWVNWVFFVSPGDDQAVALQAAETVLRSVQVTPGYTATVERPTAQSFIGAWSHGPDQSLTVSSAQAGREDVGPGAGCEGGTPSLGCHITLVLKLALLLGSSVVTATVTQVKAYYSATRYAVDPPVTKQLLASGVLPVGAKMTFEGIAPGMLVQTSAARADAFPVEWPYWCNYYRQTPAERHITNYCS
jgi:hypothetical protein